MLLDLVENLHSLSLSLIASQYAEADRAICGCRNFILCLSHQKHRLSVADWKVLSELQRQCIRHAVFSLACEGVAGMQQSTSTDGSLTVLHRPESICWEETGKSSSTKGRLHDDTKQEAKTLINLSSCDMLSLYCCM